jgi:hypothetical protein
MPFINSSKQGGTESLGEGRGIVTGGTCVPASLNTNLGDMAVTVLFRDWGCAYLILQVKAIKPHLALFMSSSHRLFIISPQQTLFKQRLSCFWLNGPGIFTCPQHVLLYSVYLGE